MISLLAARNINLGDTVTALKLGGLAMLGIFVVMLIVFITITIVNKAGNGEIKFINKIKESLAKGKERVKSKKKA